MPKKLYPTYLERLLSDAIAAENLDMLKKLVDDILPFYDSNDIPKLHKEIAVMGYVSQNKEIFDYCAGFAENLLPDSALKYIQTICDNGLAIADDQQLTDSIHSLGDLKAMAIVTILSSGRYGAKLSADEKNNLVGRVLDECQDAPQSAHWSKLDMLGHGTPLLSNANVRKLIRFANSSMDSSKYSLDKKMELIRFAIRGTGQGSDIRIGAEDLPVIEGGVVKNGAFLIAAMADDVVGKKDSFSIAFLSKNCEESVETVRANPIFVFEAPNPYKRYIDGNDSYVDAEYAFRRSSLRFVDKNFFDREFQTYVDAALFHGISIPEGYSLCIARLDELSSLPVAPVATERLEKAKSLFQGLWIAPAGACSSHSMQANSQSVTFSNFAEKLIGDPSFLHAFKQSPFCTKENLQIIVNTLTDGNLETNKSSKYSFYAEMNKLIVFFHNEFGCLPKGEIFLNSRAMVELFHEAGIQFSDNLKLINDHTKSMVSDFTQDTYNRIADMKGAICLTERSPTTPDEALKLAARRSTQMMYTALLRTFDLQELKKLASKDREWDCLVNAYPEHRGELIEHASAAVKRKSLADDLSL